MAVGIEILRVAISVGTWDAGVVPKPSSGAVLPTSSVGLTDEYFGSYWWKTPWNRTGAASVATKIFSPTLVMELGTVLTLGLTLDGGDRKGTWL